MSESKVLLIDDDGDFKEKCVEISPSFSISLELAGSLKEGRDKIESTGYDAFIISGDLNDGNPEELIDWIKEERSRAKKTIVFVASAYQNMSGYRKIKGELGVQYFYNKPIASKEVRFIFAELQETFQYPPGMRGEPLLNKVRKDYEKAALDLLEDFEITTKRICEKSSVDLLRQFGKSLRQMAGEAGSFGFEEASKVCQQMEYEVSERIEESGLVDSDWAAFLSKDFMKRLKVAFQKPRFRKSDHSKEERPLFYNDKHPDVFLVSKDVKLLQNAAKLGKKRGLDVITEEDPRFAYRWLILHAFCPKLLIIDEDFEDPEFTGHQLIRAYQEDKKRFHTTLGILSDGKDLEMRYKAMELGVELFIETPVSIDKLLDVCEMVIDPIREDKIKVVIFSHEENFAKLLTHLLHEMDCETHLETKEETLFDTISDFGPDLLLLDAELKERSGLEVLKMVRGNYLTKSLPAMLIAKENDEESIVTAFSIGIEDCIAKPLSHRIFQSRIANFSKNRAMMDFYRYRDPVTGLIGKDGYRTMLEMATARCQQAKSKLSLAIVQFDGLKEVLKSCDAKVESQLMTLISSSLLNCMRKTDVISRWSEETFAVIMENTDILHAQFMLGHIVEKVSELVGKSKVLKGKMQVRAGLSTFPKDGKSIEKLEQVANQALELAEKEGNNRVIPYSEKVVRRPKILLLENDEKQLKAWGDAFEMRGFIVKRYSELKTLTKEFKRGVWTILPILTICDQKMEEENTGILLEKLPEEIVKGSPIVLTISSPNKNDLTKAVQAGCKEFLKKPFTVRALMEKASSMMVNGKKKPSKSKPKK